ncbi:MAG: hypothetical protein JO359_01930 [Candidatus Eremiobacteraeota bacterium]|nr:hypothetical protein [Candidatus Eremiobacteraeota bacterium]
MTVFVLLRRITERFSDEQFAPLLEPESEEARRLYADGHLRAIYSRQDVPGAVLQLECASLDEAKKLAQRLPLLAKGMLEPVFVPVGPYRGFTPRNP